MKDIKKKSSIKQSKLKKLLNIDYKKVKTQAYNIYKSDMEAKNKAKIEQYKLLSKLRFSTKVNINDLISDTRYFRKGIFSRIKDKLTGKSLVQCVIHMDSGNDLVRIFPIYRNNIVDINNTLYMFSPDSFRHINGVPTLYFYQGIPFAILHKPKEMIPTIDAKAFTSIQKSKFVSDALEGDDKELGSVLLWIMIVITFLTMIGLIVFMVMTMEKFKLLGV